MMMSRLERLYRLVVIAEAVVGMGGVVGGLLAFVGVVRPTENETPPVLIPTMAILATLLFVKMGVRLIAARSMTFPFPPGLQRKASLAALAAFVLVMGYGVLRWPAGPIRATAEGYVDKAGRLYGHDAFAEFKKWETALILFFLPAALGGLADIPTKGIGAAQQLDAADEARASSAGGRGPRS